MCTVCLCVCCLKKRQSVCVFVTKRLLAALIHKAFGTCFRHLLPGPSPLWLSPLVKRPDSRAGVCVCVSCVCISGCVLISFCMPASLQVSACWCHTGESQKTLPGKCTWSSTRRTAGEGLSLRRRSLLLTLFSFNLSTRRTSSPIPLPATSSPPLMRRKHAQSHADPLVLRGHSHTCTYTHTDADIFPAWGPLLILQTQQGRTWCVTDTLAAVDRLHYCLKQLSQ